MGLAACDRGEATFGRADRRIANVAASPAAEPQPDFPAFSCVRDVSRRRWLYEVAAVVPEGRRRVPRPQDRGWAPRRIVDVAVLPDGYAVLDAGSPAVTIFSTDFASRRTIAPPPGGMSDPVAVAADATGDTLWVLEAGPSRLLGFSRRGDFVAAIAIEAPGASSLAIDDGGRFYVASPIVGQAVRTDLTAASNAVVIFDRAGSRVGSLVRAEPAEMAEGGLALAGLTPVRVATAGRQVAVYYPVDGVVDVYDGRSLVASARVCIPEELAAHYSAQRDSLRKGRSNREGWIRLVTGVLLDRSGGVATVGPSRTSDGEYHIDTFDARGRALGSIVMPANYITLPLEVRFVGDAGRLIAFGESGVIALFEVRDTVPSAGARPVAGRR